MSTPAGGREPLSRLKMVKQDPNTSPGRNKRARLNPPPQPPNPPAENRCWTKGTVKKIKMFNFMGGSGLVEVVPGPRLNLILGPNGTGKSTMVCAICLGLAGNPQLLGRSEIVKDYIKHGETEAWVEITLSADDHGKPVTFRRHMKPTSGSSEWKLDNKSCTMKDVKDRVKELNVQLDNLCQFLPQDKVGDFAKLKPVELLAETQKAIGDARLHALHRELIQERNQLKTEETAKKALDDNLAGLRTQNEGLARDARRFEQREELLQQKQTAEHCLLWLKYSAAQEKFREDKNVREEAERRLSTMSGNLATAEKPVKAKEQRAKAEHEQLMLHKRAAVKSDELTTSTANTSTMQMTRIAKEWEEVDALAGQEKNRLGKINLERQRVAKLEAELAKMPAVGQAMPPELQAERQAKEREARQLDMQAADCQSQLDTVNQQLDAKSRYLQHLQGQIERMQNVRHQRIMLLEQRGHQFRGIGRFAEWLAANRSRFRGNVYGPVVAEVNVADKNHALILEQAVALTMWGRFVTTFEEDMQQMVQEARERFNLKIIVSNYRGNPAQAITHPQGDAAQYARWGIEHTLDEVMEGPQVIKHMLNDENGLGRAYLGVRTTQAQAGDFLEQISQVTDLWTMEHHYRTYGSRYSNARSQAIDPVRTEPGLLSSSGSASDQQRHNAEQTYQQHLQEHTSMRELQHKTRQEYERLNQDAQELRQQSRQIADKHRAALQKRTKLQTQLSTAQQRLAKMEEAPSSGVQEGKLRDKIAKLSSMLPGLAKKLQEALAACADNSWAVMVSSLAAKEAKVLADEAAKALATQRQEVNKFHSSLDRLKDMVQKSKDACKKARDAAVNATGTDRQEELQPRFEGLTREEPALQAYIDEKQEQADAIVCTNPGALEEYRRREARIAELTEQQAAAADKLELCRQIIAQKKEQWLPELLRIVGIINTSFSHNFRDIGCAGEVSLGVHGKEGTGPVDFEDPSLDYEQLAIHIMVKFRRDEPLQLLTGQRQSGGERAVSTILYLIAIQSVTVCPFRVVDEINQGMDVINERKVFVLLSAAAGRQGTPQCFLLTPKLLPELPFSADCTVLSIVNGPLLSRLALPFNKSKIHGSISREVQVA